jgi:urease accessory protein
MARIFKIAGTIAAVALATAGAAEAHVGQHVVASLAGGIAHPFSGMDHMAAMVAVGLLGAVMGGKNVWRLPVAFMIAMALAAAAGAAGIALPMVETGIAASIVAFAVAIMARAKLSSATAMALVSFFALFHGLAHGAEMPGEGGVYFGAGFLIATAILHTLGAAIGTLATRRRAASAI